MLNDIIQNERKLRVLLKGWKICPTFAQEENCESALMPCRAFVCTSPNPIIARNHDPTTFFS